MNSCVKDILQDDFWIMPQTPEYIEEGIPYITSKNIKNGKIDFSKVNYISQEAFEKISKNRPILVGDILISMIGTLGETAEVTVNDGVFYGQNMFLVRLDESKVDKRYFLNYFKSNYVKRALAEKQNQSTQKYLKANHIEDLYIPVPTVEQQRNVACILDTISEMINFRKQQLQQLDELVKARFVELFGDIKVNNLNIKTVPMTELCEIIDGDRGKNYPKQEEFYEEGFCLFLNAKNVTSNGFDFSNCMYVSKEKDEALRKGKLTRGDVVLTTRGTIGNLAYYCDDVPYENIRINSGMVILRMNHKIVDEIFFIEQFKLQLEDIKRKVASGSAQPQLPISTMNKINMIVPPINEQKNFSEFVKQVDKSKVVVQKALDEAQTLFDSLMQEYFG